jgi:dihydrodipicolinate synthase/N-acetylneuraminate lyase
MRSKIGGAILCPYLPFDENKQLKERVLTDHLDVILKAKPDGLYVLGSVDEFAVIPIEQRKRITETVVSIVAKRVPVVIHVGTLTLEQTIELAQHAEKVGADAIYCVPPYYYLLDDRAHLDYFRRVAQSISIPVHIYNIPETTKVNFSVGVLSELGKTPGITAVKDSTGDIRRVQELVAVTGLDIFQGDECLFLSSLVVGAAGCISALVGTMRPDLTVQLVNAFRQRELTQAIELQDRVATIRRQVLHLHPNWIQLVKESVRLVWGWDMGRDIVGYSPMTKEDIQNLEKLLKRLAVI